MTGKHRVFVSSVQKELAAERSAVRDFIEGDALLRRFFDVERAFPGATAQVTAQVAAQVAIFCRKPRSAREIMEYLKLHYWKTFQANYLKPLIQDGLLERTIPDKPTSRLQKYRITEKCHAWLAGGRS